MTSKSVCTVTTLQRRQGRTNGREGNIPTRPYSIFHSRTKIPTARLSCGDGQSPSSQRGALSVLIFTVNIFSSCAPTVGKIEAEVQLFSDGRGAQTSQILFYTLFIFGRGRQVLLSDICRIEPQQHFNLLSYFVLLLVSLAGGVGDAHEIPAAGTLVRGVHTRPTAERKCGHISTKLAMQRASRPLDNIQPCRHTRFLSLRPVGLFSRSLGLLSPSQQHLIFIGVLSVDPFRILHPT